MDYFTNSTINFDDPNNCNQLYTLFTGKDSKIKDKKVPACSPRLKLKILNFLMKCRGPALNVPKSIQVIFEGLFGETTNQKVKVAVLQFAANFISFGNHVLIEKLCQVLHTYITKLVGIESPEPSAVQNAALLAIAKLIQVFPSHFDNNVNLVVQYFDFLKGSTPDLQDSIKECLMALAQAFKWKSNSDEKMDVDGDNTSDSILNFAPSSNQIIILGILRDQCESKNSTALNVASFFLNTCFPNYFVPARYMLLWICGICSQLKEGIYTYLYGSQRKDHITYENLVSYDSENAVQEATEKQKIILPSFKIMISHIDEEFERKASKSKERLGNIDLDVFTEILDYVRLTLWYSAGCNCEPGTDNAKLIEYMIDLKNKGDTDCIVKYVKLIRSILIIRKNLTELDCLLDLYDAPWIVCSNEIKISDTLKILSNTLKDVNETIRTKSAKIYGIHLAYDSSNSEFNSEISQLLNLTQKSLELQHGSILALSNACFYRAIYYKQNNKENELKQFLQSKEYTDLISLLVKLLTDQRSLLQLASLKGLSLLGCYKLPFDDGKDKDEDSDNEMHSKMYVLTTTVQLLKSSHSKQKVREEAALCLGYLSIGDNIFFSRRVINHFLDMKRMTKDAALHISIAKAFAFIFAGDEHLPKEILHNMKDDDELLEWTLKELMKIVVEVNVCSRQAVSLWLLAIVRACCDRKPVMDKKRSLQMAFTHLLSENNELVQQVSSRGLGIIYSTCSEDDKKELSNMLIENLTEGNRGMNQKVAEDTVLFEEGMLSKTPTGQNLSTYKDLCSMASEMNNPGMIYNFMQLANNNANWNTKLGAAFSLQAISTEHTKENMLPFISKIVPKLYRYKYDPTPKIQNQMIQIWDSIIKDNNQTLDLYYWEILDDLSKNLTNTEWRTRIASTLALRDLIRRPGGLRLKSIENNKEHKDADKMETDAILEPELNFLWSQLFRVMDDIHEGTREAAEGTAKLLSKICVNSVSCDHGEKRSFLITNAVLPILLEGIVHVVQEIRFLSLKTISEMIDSTGNLIQPHLPILIPCLLRATGELDSAKLSMLSNMVSGQGGSQEIVDSMRAEEAKNHYTMNTLKKCIKYVDISAMEKANQSILELIKNGVNLGTKVACADFVHLITLHLNKELQPYAAKYLSACVSALSDRNPIVRKHYAAAIGDLVLVAKDSTVISLFKKLTTLYFEDQEGKSKTIALTLQAINKKHGEILNSNATSVLPLMFFAKHEAVTEENKSTVEMWIDLWNDVNFGDSLLQNHFNDIISLLETSINHQSWKLKAQSGSTVEALAKRLSDNLKHEERNRLIELIMENISGRTFNGKEKLVEALAALCDKSCNTELNDRIIQAVLKECRKEEEAYKTKVLGSLGTILEKLETENRFEDVFNIVWTLLDKPINATNREQEGTNDDERGKTIAMKESLKEAACDVLGKSWPNTKASNSIETQKKYQLLLITKLTESFKSNTRKIQMKLCNVLGMFLQKSYLTNDATSNDSEELHKICKLVMENISEASGKYFIYG